MLTKIRRRVVSLVVVAVLGAVAIAVGDETPTGLGQQISALVGLERVSVVEENGQGYAVAASAKSKLGRCKVDQVLAKKCDGVKIVIMDAAKMPFITHNIAYAWMDGHPGVLTKNSAQERQNRSQVCLATFPKPNGGWCDEYPFASTSEGGAGAREMEVPAREQRCQGGTLSRAYAGQAIRDQDAFVVVISSPHKIASGPFEGDDIGDPACAA